MGLWGFGAVGLLGCGTWGCGTMRLGGIWDCGNLGLWEHGTVGTWGYGTMELRGCEDGGCEDVGGCAFSPYDYSISWETH